MFLFYFKYELKTNKHVLSNIFDQRLISTENVSSFYFLPVTGTIIAPGFYEESLWSVGSSFEIDLTSI